MVECTGVVGYRHNGTDGLDLWVLGLEVDLEEVK